jgi:aminodeoxyfutalosine synthase
MVSSNIQRGYLKGDLAIINTSTPADQSLKPIVDKVLAGQRLSLEDGLKLYQTDDLLTLGHLADWVNRQRNGKRVYFIQNMYINPTNVCEAKCAFCGFRKDLGQKGAYTMSPEEVLDYVRQRYYPGICEFHLVGGHNPYQPFSYYVKVIAKLKEHYPNVTIKAYTAAEIEFFSRLANKSYREVLTDLIQAGLDTLPGGGAEILTERYRKKMSPDKASTQQWLEIHQLAHDLGLKTHATMLYGSIESLEERLTHMLQLRQLQDITQGFLVFIPLAIQPRSPKASLRMRTSAVDDLRTIAISRLMLDNFPHIKAYFINIGPQLAQLATHFGASDLHGTIIEERISHSAGALWQNGITKQELIWLIQTAQRLPVERDTFYNIIQEYPSSLSPALKPFA